MSAKGEKLAKDIAKLREYIDTSSPKKGPRGFFEGVLSALEGLNARLQELEREFGPSDAFVDPNEGTHRII